MKRNGIIAAASIAVFVLICAIVAAAYIYSGAYNAAATDDVGGLTAYVLSTATTRSIQAHAEPVDPPAAEDSVLVRRGYRAFSDMCVVCHGAPGEERGWMGQGMTPEPPRLSHAAEEYSTAELVWVVKHGIKHAGMPALAPTHSDEEVRELVAFVERLPDMTAEEYQALRASSTSDVTEAADGDGHEGHEH